MTVYAKAAAVFLVLMNTAAFALMGIDKKKARLGRRRIPEKTLFLFAALFGALGGTLGMYAFHHKTRHWYFKLFFPVFAAAQIALILILNKAI